MIGRPTRADSRSFEPTIGCNKALPIGCFTVFSILDGPYHDGISHDTQLAVVTLKQAAECCTLHISTACGQAVLEWLINIPLVYCCGIK